MNRREFLRTGLILGAGACGGLAGWIIADRYLRNNKRTEKLNLFNPFPADFDCKWNKDYCYVDVHSERNEAENISGGLTICVVDNRLYEKAIEAGRRDKIWGNNPVIVTEGGGTPKEFVYSGDWLGKEQDVNVIYSFLRERGIKEVRFKGQNVWGCDGQEGCLGEQARYFHEAGFRVRGVKGQMIPNYAPTNQNCSKIIMQLYADQAE